MLLHVAQVFCLFVCFLKLNNIPLYVHVWVLSCFTCVQLFATPWTCLADSSVHGILQARIVEWFAISSFRASGNPLDMHTFSLSIHMFSIDIHILALVNTASVNAGVLLSLRFWFYFFWMYTQKWNCWVNYSIFSFMRKFNTVFQSGCPILHP